GKLSGTLLLPDGGGARPVVMMIAGSGPTDRNGNSTLLAMGTGYLEHLARALGQAGIATFRYDKRGIGESLHPGLREADLRFRHMVDDAVALAQRLRGDARLGRLVMLGHSEGALIAALAAPRAGAAAVAHVAGAGVRASDLLRRQLQSLLPPDLQPAALATLAALEDERLVADPPEALTLLFRPSVQPYLISWFRYDPAEVLEDLPLPLLLVQGTADAQVRVEDARRVHAGRPDAKLLLVEGMDHGLAVRGDLQGGVRQVAEAVAALVGEVQRAAV
ncbi:MAG: hydrolase, alpha/beta fold family, partial [Ramlibacter sp.]|nr:hydrolase, alpha/beta fold family [Ramlibacter sp.]